MINFKSKIAVLCIASTVVFSLLNFGVLVAQDETKEPANQGDAKIQFSFEDAEWKSIIEWFAKEANLTLQPINEPPPGTFSLSGPEKYTVLEGMDVINHALTMRGYWLVRNKQMLILVNAEDQLPPQLIEIVPTEDLEKRGKYEVIKTVFSLKGIDVENIRNEVEPLIDRRHLEKLAIMGGAELMMVQETGGTLRFIRDMLDKARENTGKQPVQVVKLEHISQEDLMVVARKMLQIPDDRYVSIDGSLSIVPEPLGLKLFVSGTPDMMEKFLALVEKIDVPQEGDVVEPEELVLKVYPVRGNLELAQKVVDTMLQGRPEIRMSPDEEKGALIVRARPSDHMLVQETLDSIEKGNSSFDIYFPKVMDPDDLSEQMMSLFGQDSLDDTATGAGPTIVPDSTNNRILLRGTPVEVEKAMAMAERLDVRTEVNAAERTNVRVISMSDTQKEKAVTMLSDLLSSSNYDNRINFVYPKGYDPNNKAPWYMRNQNVDAANRGIRNIRSTNNPGNNNQQDMEQDQGSGGNGDSNESGNSQLNNNPPKSSDSDETTPRKSSMVLPGKRLKPLAYTSLNGVAYQQDEGNSDSNKRPEDQDIQSIAGSDVEIKITEYGIVIKSADLDALDEIEYLIQQHITGLSDFAAPSVFWLKHRTATYMKSKLDEILGQGDSGGGAGGGLGGLLGGAMSNMVGGAAGQMLGGLMGGGGGSSAAALETEDAVTIVADDTTNSLLITATENDLALVADLIELYDRDSSVIDPDTVGATYVVPLLYRDAAEIETILKAQLADVIKTEGGQGGNNAQEAQAAMQRQIIQAISGGGRGRGNRGGGGGGEEEKPKVRVSIDEVQNAIVITGPSDLAERVKKTVEILDIPNSNVQIINFQKIPDGVDSASLTQLLQGAFPEKVQINTSGETANGTPGSTTPGQNRGATGGNNAANAARQQFLQQLMQQRGGNTRGGNTRGGNTRGGGNRGGGRGGRGGGN